MEMLRKRDSAQLLLDVTLQTAIHLDAAGISELSAIDIAQEVSDFLCHHWGHQTIYFSYKKLSVKLLESSIETAFDGTSKSISLLAKRYGVTVRKVYMVLQGWRASKRKELAGNQNLSAKGERMGGIRREESGQVLLDCILQMTKLLVEKGIAKETAITVAQEVAEFLARHWNGSAVYFSAKTLGRRIVETELARNFNGSRDMILRLVRKHGVSQTFCYEVLKRLREKLKDKKGE